MEILLKLSELWKSIRPKHINKMSGLMIFTGIAGESAPFWWPYAVSILNYFIELNSGHTDYIRDTSNIFILLLVLGSVLVVLDRVLDHLSEKENSKPLFDADDSSIEIIDGTIKSAKPLSKLRNKSKFKMENTEVNDGK
ncbi:TPA: hypothetical protein NKQ81_004615 [Vibrio parahaemolyticus]|nr:hypothetical protein [Vibrio parahaemolyticus]HCH1474569.1 hypothetical protein [Vibrio parahaemolyticus]